MSTIKKHEIVSHMVNLCELWLKYGYKPGHGRDYMNQIFNQWKLAWDAGLVQSRSMSMDSMTESVAIAYCEKFGIQESPSDLQSLLERISLVWFAYTCFAEQHSN